ncbi:hypothetical protein H0R92_10220 [Treponema sp. OMZ 840]|uniref:hypothetical protein n=1 Tax=Treponema sp. OMZ 840 TaxID=244313 RepID=UPI003D8E50D8
MKKKYGIIISVLAFAAVIFMSCATVDEIPPDERALAAGIQAWHEREPADAAVYWNEIQDEKLKKKYLGYIDLYKAGAESLNKTDSIKASNETKLREACNKAIEKFSAIDPALKLPTEVAEKGAAVSAKCIKSLVTSGKVTAARKMHESATKVFGSSDELAEVHKEIEIVSSLYKKKSNLDSQAESIASVESFEDKVAAYDKVIASYASAEKEINSAAANAGLAKSTALAPNMRVLRKARQDLTVSRAALIRERAYDYKNKINEEFARTPENAESGKMSLEDILAHHKSIEKNIDVIYQDLLGFASKYPNDIGQDIIDDINAQKKDLEAKIAQVNAEIRTAQEIASRGKVVIPLIIGLFNPDPRSTAESKRSRPAKFSASNVKKDEYWWGMVSIPRGQMNDLVITLKDNRTVRAFAENTKSGKLIEKNKMKDLINRSYKVGNSWPILNAGSQLTSDKYFFEVQKGKTPDYSGEVVVYSSFIVRMR